MSSAIPASAPLPSVPRRARHAPGSPARRRLLGVLSTLAGATLLAPLVGLAALGCGDSSKAMGPRAAELADKLVPVTAEDARQVREGFPPFAEKLAGKLDADPGANPAGVRTSLGQARNAVQDLAMSKITFLAYCDEAGVAVRSEGDPDTLATKNVLGAIPELAKVREAKKPLELFTDLPELRMTQQVPEQEWVVGLPVSVEGKPKGFVITGWSLRAYARRLEDQASRDLKEQSKKLGEKNEPLVYALLAKGKAIYGGPKIPEVTTKALADLDVVGKTSGGAWVGSLELTGRTYAVAAKRAPALGDDTAVIVMLSGI